MSDRASLDRATPADLHILQVVLDNDGYKGAAQHLGVPVATVRTRMHRALKRTGYASLAAAAREMGRRERVRTS